MTPNPTPRALSATTARPCRRSIDGPNTLHAFSSATKTHYSIRVRLDGSCSLWVLNERETYGYDYPDVDAAKAKAQEIERDLPEVSR